MSNSSETGGNNLNDVTAAAEPAQQRRRAQQKDIPLSNVIKIMRSAIPGGVRIADDAKETVQKCVTEFIHYVTAKANERSRQEQRRTVTADDLIWAMRALGLGSYAEELTDFIIGYRQQQEYGRAGASARHLPPVNTYAPPPVQGFPVPEFSPGPINDGAGGSSSSSAPYYGGGGYIDPSFPTNFDA